MGREEFTYLPGVQEVLLEELVSERKVAETGSTHQLHPQWWEPTWGDNKASRWRLSGRVLQARIEWLVDVVSCAYVSYLGWTSDLLDSHWRESASNLLDLLWRRSADDRISRAISRTPLLPCHLRHISLTFGGLWLVSAQAQNKSKVHTVSSLFLFLLSSSSPCFFSMSSAELTPWVPSPWWSKDCFAFPQRLELGRASPAAFACFHRLWMAIWKAIARRESMSWKYSDSSTLYGFALKVSRTWNWLKKAQMHVKSSPTHHSLGPVFHSLPLVFPVDQMLQFLVHSGSNKWLKCEYRHWLVRQMT